MHMAMWHPAYGGPTLPRKGGRLLRLYAKDILVAIERATDRTWDEIAESLGKSGPALLRKLQQSEPNLSAPFFFKVVRAARVSFADTTTKKEFISKLARARITKCMTHEDVAHRCGRSAWTVGKVLAGQQTPRLNTMLTLCDALDVPPTVR